MVGDVLMAEASRKLSDRQSHTGCFCRHQCQEPMNSMRSASSPSQGSGLRPNYLPSPTTSEHGYGEYRASSVQNFGGHTRGTFRPQQEKKLPRLAAVEVAPPADRNSGQGEAGQYWPRFRSTRDSKRIMENILSSRLPRLMFRFLLDV